MDLTRNYEWSKKSLEWIVEDGASGILAVPWLREESASHHVKFGNLDPEILKSKGSPGTSTGGPPLEAVWRIMLTWRNVLRTKMGKWR